MVSVGVAKDEVDDPSDVCTGELWVLLIFTRMSAVLFSSNFKFNVEAYQV